MGLPKFWKDSGHGDETVVQLSIVFSLGAWAYLAYKLNYVWLGLATVLLGPLTGFVVGILLIYVLSTYFAEERDQE